MSSNLTDAVSNPLRIRTDLDAMPSYVPGKRFDNALKLSSNEVSFEPLPAARKAMADAVAHANRYPDLVAVELRETLAEHLDLSFDQVAVGCGSSALCQQLVQITSGPGDEVIFPWRSFEAYPIFTQVTGATPVAIPLTADGYNDLDAMADAITDKTTLIFVCNPNNPTGTVVTEQAFIEFMDKVPADVIVALDEAYTEYLRTEDTPLANELITTYPNLVGLRTFSKAFGLAGMRVGYCFGDPRIITALNKVALPFGVNLAAQAGAVASLNAVDELLERTEDVARNRDRAAQHIGTPLSQANFIWIDTLGNPERSTEIAAALLEQGVVVRSFPEGVRITITNDEETDRLLAAWDAAKLR